MLHPNVDVGISRSFKWVGIFALLVLVVGMGISIYKNIPEDPPPPSAASGGAITIVAPAVGFSRGVVVKPGAGACVHQGETLTTSSKPITLKTSEGMKTLTEFPSGPHISNEFGEIPEGTIFRYQSRTARNVTVKCFNVTVV